MRNKTFSVVYSLVLVMMIAAAVFVAIDALSTTAVIVVAALVFSVLAAIITDIMFLKPRKEKPFEPAIA